MLIAQKADANDLIERHDKSEASTGLGQFGGAHDEKPEVMTESMSASAISDTSPSPSTIKSPPIVDAAAPSSSARRKVFAAIGPVAARPHQSRRLGQNWFWR